MRVYIQPRTYDHERAFFLAIAECLAGTGHQVTDDRRETYDAAIVWNGRGWRATVPTLYAEMGWLPRWGFQLSHLGINAESHLAKTPPRSLSKTERRKVQQKLVELRAAPCPFKHFSPSGETTQHAPVEPFLLAPLQVEQDTNMRYVPEALRTAEGFVAAISEWSPPLPVVFKTHPATLAKAQRELQLERPQDHLATVEQGNIHAWLKHPNCAGVVTLNSNTANDALIWGRPVIALARGVWPAEVFAGELLDGAEFDAWIKAGDSPARLDYAAHLMEHQWSLADAGDRGRIQAALADAIAGFKRPKRRRGAERVNVYCRDLGWLFEDLKGWFETVGGSGVSASEHPDDDAAAWVCMRTDEVTAAPDLSRTVVCVHDQNQHGGLQPLLGQLGGVVLTHPEQAARLLAGSVEVPHQMMLRPIGAPESFQPQRRPQDWFTVGWVGRDTGAKGLEVFHRAVGKAASAVPIRVVLLGAQLEGAAAQLRRDGHPVDLFTRDAVSYSDYPSIYAKLDVLLITSQSEAGPLPLFEALACGVPVISTPCGWAPLLLHDGYNGFVRDNAAEMTHCIKAVAGERTRWQERAEAISASLMGWSLEGWVRQVIELARATL